MDTPTNISERICTLPFLLLKQKQVKFLTLKNGHTYKYPRKAKPSAVLFADTKTDDLLDH